MRCLLFIAVIITAYFYGYGQENIFGDTALISDIQAKCSSLYNTQDKTDFFVTKKKFYKHQVSGTNIVAYSKKGNLFRIVVNTYVRDGQLSGEYFYWENSLIMIYETLEYYAESSPEGQVKNFMGIPFWETRFYFDDSKIVAHKHTGRRDVGKDYSGGNEMAESNNILNFVKGQVFIK
ncbi:MAG TPA: hypothetical protein VFW11_15725 [Cyclobacteriaceae bacterium]|nr:hypothetical protein [Cyclobacteriaceae bacterium]